MKKLFFLFSIIFSWTCLSSQALNSYFVDSLIRHYSKQHTIVGLSIGVVHKNASYTKSYGYTAHNKTDEITDSTLFNVASISKLFTATAIMQLVEAGKLKLTDKLANVLPGFQMKDHRHLEITIQQLLTHSSGLMWDNHLKNSPDNPSALSLYLKELEDQKLAFKPGTKMSYATYSNVAFDLLGMVIEKVANQSFEDYVTENILLKTGMVNSTYTYETIDSTQLALPQIIAGSSKAIKRLNFKGIDRKRNPILNNQPLALTNHITVGESYEHNPSGNLLSSTSELNLWMKELLSTYHQKTSQGTLKTETLLSMWQENKQVEGKEVSIGLGWWVKQNQAFGNSYFHVGTNPGYSSILMVYPKQEFGIVILCNGWYAKDIIWKQLFNDLTKLFVN